jgi:hypothetical protein
MKREFSPAYLALFLVLGCVSFRVLSSHFPEVIPNISPLMAIAFVGAMYLPARWGWLVGPVTLIMTELAFLDINYRTDGSGSMFSWWMLISLGLYALVGVLGILIARRKSISKIIAGSLSCSLLFYLAANTFSWWHDIVVKMPLAYAPTWAGWWQANTMGVPGYPPTYIFLRNGMAGDLFFVFLLLFILDRGFLFGQAPFRPTTRLA